VITVEGTVELALSDGRWLRQLQLQIGQRLGPEQFHFFRRKIRGGQGGPEEFEGQLRVRGEYVGAEREGFVVCPGPDAATHPFYRFGDLLGGAPSRSLGQQAGHEGRGALLPGRVEGRTRWDGQGDGDHRLSVVLHQQQREAVGQALLLEGGEDGRPDRAGGRRSGGIPLGLEGERNGPNQERCREEERETVHEIGSELIRI
jgi:hypothetical protein